MPAVVLLALLPFTWFGMVAAISFLETPLKFRAPGMTRALGVGIGRLVFKALNSIEAVLAAALIVAWLLSPATVGPAAGALLVLAMAALALQMLLLRPAMAKRTAALSPTSPTHDGGAAVETRAGTSTHIAYITSEALKVLALPVAGILIVVGVAG